MNEEFAHGGDHDAFVGFTFVLEALDIGPDDRVVSRGALGGHIETRTHLGASGIDVSFARSFATVSVEGSQTDQGDGFVAFESTEFIEVGDERPTGDLSDAADSSSQRRMCP